MASIKQARLQLRMRRFNLGLTPEELGAEVGLSGMTIRRLEDGEEENPTMRTRRLLAAKFDIPVSDVWPMPPAKAKVAA